MKVFKKSLTCTFLTRNTFPNEPCPSTLGKYNHLQNMKSGNID